MITLTSQEGEALVFAVVEADDFSSVVDGIIEMSWGGFAGTEGFHDQAIAEIWRDDLDDTIKPDGTLEICLGRWHALPAPEVERLRSWLDSLLEGRAMPVDGKRLRQSPLAV